MTQGEGEADECANNLLLLPLPFAYFLSLIDTARSSILCVLLDVDVDSNTQSRLIT